MTADNQYISMKLMTDCLLQRGYTMRDLGIKPRFLEFTAPAGWKWLTRYSFVSYPFVSMAVSQITNNKQRSYSFVSAHNVSVPRTLTMPGDATMLPEFRHSYAPLVVKPLDSFSSRGMELNVRTKDEAMHAIATAHKYSQKVLVQQQFQGSEVRFTVLHGKVVHCLQRETPRVISDGTSSMAQLISAENEARRRLGNRIVPYPQLDATIVPQQMLQSAEVPSKGEVVELNKSSLVAGGGVMRNVSGLVHKSYEAIAEQLTVALNPAFMIVDMLISDFTQPATASNYVFLEFSIAPSLRLYYDVRSGQNFDIVNHLADMIGEWGERV